MGLKTITALCAGILLQLSQIGSCLPANAFETAASGAACASSCCEEMESCPCFEMGGQDEKPVPLVPAQMDPKGPLAKSPERVKLVSVNCPAVQATPTAAIVRDGRGGYSGVHLSVAFCSFVI